MTTEYLDVVFDGPGPESGRFIEIEDDKGASVNFGEWVQRTDGYWVLRLWADTHTHVADTPTLPEPETKPDKTKKPVRLRRTKKEKAPRAMKVDLNFAMVAMAGLKEVVSKVVTAMQPFGKKQRSRIVHALAKLFA